MFKQVGSNDATLRPYPGALGFFREAGSQSAVTAVSFKVSTRITGMSHQFQHTFLGPALHRFWTSTHRAEQRRACTGSGLQWGVLSCCRRRLLPARCPPSALGAWTRQRPCVLEGTKEPKYKLLLRALGFKERSRFRRSHLAAAPPRPLHSGSA